MLSRILVVLFALGMGLRAAGPEERIEAWQESAREHEARGEVEMAGAALEAAMELTAPGSWRRGELQARMIRLYQRADRAAELEARWRERAETQPRDRGALLQLIDFYEKTGDLRGQQEWLGKLGALEPGDAGHKLRLARVLALQDDFARAAKLYDEVLAARPEETEAVFERARLEVLERDSRGAMARIEKLLAAKPEDEALRAAALGFFARHRLDVAREKWLHAAAESGDEEAVMALAEFYFSQRKAGAARRALERLVRPDDPPQARAAAMARVAATLKANGETAAALEMMRGSVSTADGWQGRLALAELLAAAGDVAGAYAAAERAYELARDDQERKQADRALFQILLAAASKPDPDAAERTGAGSPALQRLVVEIERAALAEPTGAKLLRAARWRSWNRDATRALDLASRAVELEPDSIAAREELLSIASAAAQTKVVAEQLQELIGRDPAHAAEYRRRLAQLRSDSGRLAEALEEFGALAAENPEDIALLVDLATTQQRAGMLGDALKTWRRAYDSSPPERRREIAQPLLRAMEEAGQHRQAAELLLAAMDAPGDERKRELWLIDLVKLTRRHDLLGWLRAVLEQRLAAQPGDHFSQIALAAAFEAAGERTRALRLLVRASYSAPQEDAALERLVREAVSVGDFSAAIGFQERLLARGLADDPAALEKLAALQESDLRIEEALATWGKVAARFPRDAAALKRAAWAFHRWAEPERERDLLRRVRALEPRDAGALAALGSLAARLGARDEALGCWEQILEITAQVEALIFPGLGEADADAVQESYMRAVRGRSGQPTVPAMDDVRKFWRGVLDEPEPRLRAIRGIAELLPAARRARWIARWSRSPVSSESLWALYHSGAEEALARRAAELLASGPEVAARVQGFCWLSLRAGAWAQAGTWLRAPERTEEERDLFMVAFDQFLRAHTGPLDPEMIRGLFPEEYAQRTLLWQSAVLLGERGFHGEAAALGERVWERLTSLRAHLGVELARGQVYLGEFDDARRILRGSIQDGGSSYFDPVYAALRAYAMLLPPEEGEGFVESYESNTADEPLHSALGLLLLRELAGDTEGAEEEAARLLAMRPVLAVSYEDLGRPPEERVSATARHWAHVQSSAAQLAAWGMAALAQGLLEEALADEAAIRLAGRMAETPVRELQARMAALRMASGDLVEAGEALDELMSEASPEIAQMTASFLLADGQAEEAVKILRRMWNRDRSNAQPFETVLGAAVDPATKREVLAEATAMLQRTIHARAWLEMAPRLLDALTDRRQVPDQARLVADALEQFPAEPTVLAAGGRYFSRLGEKERAAELLRAAMAAGAPVEEALIPLASVLGDAEALAALESVPPGDPAVRARVGELRLRTGDLEGAEEIAWELVRAGHEVFAGKIVAGIAEQGRWAAAARVLHAAVEQASDPGRSFELQRALIELLPADLALVSRLLARAGRTAEEAPELLPGFIALRGSILEKKGERGWFEHWLEERWQAGGEPAYGAALARELYEIGDARGEAVLGELLATPQVDETLLVELAEALRAGGRHAEAARVADRLCRDDLLDDSHFLKLAGDLHAIGHKPQALELLETVGMRYIFYPPVAGRVAKALEELGEAEAAAEWSEISGE